MLLLASERAELLSPLLVDIGFATVRSCGVDVESVRRALAESRYGTELVFFDASPANVRERLPALDRAFRGSLPLVLLLETPQPRGLIELAEQGYRFLRSWECLQRQSIHGELVEIREWYRSQRIFRDVRSFHESLLQREVLRSAGLLDTLHFGVLSLDGEGRVQATNDHLELMLGLRLKRFRGQPIDRVRASRDIPAELQRILPQHEPKSDRTETKLFALGDGVFIECTAAPLYGENDTLLGRLFAYRDVSDDVRAGLRDPETGLLTRACLQSHLNRRIAWFERYSGIPCRALSLIHVTPAEPDMGQNGAPGANLPRLADALRRAIREADSAARVAGGFLVLLPGVGEERSMSIARRLMRRLTGSAAGETSEASRAETLRGDRPRLAMGVHTHELSAGDVREELDRQLAGLITECEQAAARARAAGPDQIVHYSRSGGYRSVPL